MNQSPLPLSFKVAHAITQRLTLTSCGIFEELIEGSTKPVTEVRTHAGIARVVRYSFAIGLKGFPGQNF